MMILVDVDIVRYGASNCWKLSLCHHHQPLLEGIYQFLAWCGCGYSVASDPSQSAPTERELRYLGFDLLFSAAASSAAAAAAAAAAAVVTVL